MKRPTGSPRPLLASLLTEKTLMTNSEQRLHGVVASLEQCQAVLEASLDLETAQLVSMAILQLRMKINGIADAELKALCDAVTPQDPSANGTQHPESPQRRRCRDTLKLVK